MSDVRILIEKKTISAINVIILLILYVMYKYIYAVRNNNKRSKVKDEADERNCSRNFWLLTYIGIVLFRVLFLYG